MRGRKTSKVEDECQGQQKMRGKEENEVEVGEKMAAPCKNLWCSVKNFTMGQKPQRNHILAKFCIFLRTPAAMPFVN